MTNAQIVKQLRDARTALLHVHKALLDAERIRYEREHGRIESGNALLQLLINDPWFAWLRPASELVVQIDERLDEEEPITVADSKVLLDQARALLQPSETGDTFQTRYHAALQEFPDVVIVHREATRLLNSGNR